MHENFDNCAKRYHAELPGLVRATLHDHGIADRVVDRYQLGWDGEHVTVPIRGENGRVRFFERWDAARIGVPVNERQCVELFGWKILKGTPAHVILAEGIHEALIFESHGFNAVTATDTGRFFKLREWGLALVRMPELFLAFRRGEKRERGKYLRSRSEIVDEVREAFPDARLVHWPRGVGDQGGAYEYFVKRGHNEDEFRSLLADSQ